MLTRFEFSFLLVFLLLNVFCVRSQSNLEDFSLRRSIKQNDKHLVFFIRDEDKREIHSFKHNTWYYWFKSQQIISTQGGAGGTLLDGECIGYYSNKQLAEKGIYSKGIKNGLWTYWRSNGSISSEEKWKKGRLTNSKLFNESGELSEERIEGRNNVIVNKRDSISIYKNGKLIKQTVKDSLGALVSVSHFKNGILHGQSFSYIDGEKVSKEKYKNGEIVEPKEKVIKVKSQEEKEKGRFVRFIRNLFKKKDKEEISKRKKKLNEEV